MLNFQATPEILFPQRDIKVEESNGFSKYTRNLNLRFQIDKDRYGASGARIQLRCVARIKEVPEAAKETSATIFVPSLEKTRKQMSLNLRSRGERSYPN